VPASSLAGAQANLRGLCASCYVWNAEETPTPTVKLLLALFVAVIGCSACEVIGGYESFEARTGPVEPNPCEGLESTISKTGLKMVSTKEDNGCFYIDETEVTVLQYRRFLEGVSTPWSGDELTSCAWKVDGLSDPIDGLSDPESEVANVTTTDLCVQEAREKEDHPFLEDKPIRCVDWCDALAFCKWADQNLCSSATSLTLATTDGGSMSMYWSSACSAGGLAYPYAKTKFDSLVSGACNIGLDAAGCTNLLGTACGPTIVPSQLHCESPNHAFDMVGNVAEWTSNCARDTPAEDQACTIRGGSFADDATINCGTHTQSRKRSGDWVSVLRQTVARLLSDPPTRP
jgi:hypothetical protein